jgi:hypothetical protein
MINVMVRSSTSPRSNLSSLATTAYSKLQLQFFKLPLTFLPGPRVEPV